ncbi:MAG: ribose-phosphate diphosphokinase [Candidatus Bathyarchaeia archaeon]|jgi:ribose-phosphate pyrophosphokinase
MKIVLGPSSKQLGEKIADLLRAEEVPVAFKNFPDGESYVRLEGNVQEEEAVIVQTTSPPQDSRLIQLALMADAAKRNGARKIRAVVPYLAYARQDKIFLPGEALSIEAIANMLRVAGVDNLLTVNVHQEKVLSKFPFPAETVSAIPLLAEYFKHRGFEGAFAVAPDEGATYIAEQAERVLKGGFGCLEKQRDRYTGQVSIEKRSLEAKGKTVIIFDDIISSGGTIVAAAKILKELGAEKIYSSCVHPLLIGDAEKRILDAGVEEIVGTDSVPCHVSKVSLAPLIAKKLLG